MKCSNCGAELKVGCIYCSVCGKEAQIVPDYNLLEDDILGEMLKEKKKPNPKSKSKPQTEIKEQGVPKKKKKKRIIIALISSVTAVIAVAAVAIWQNYSHDNSVSWQMEQAEKYIEEKEYQKSIGYLERAAELEEDSVSALLVLAETYQKAGQKEDAVDACKKVLKLEQDCKEAYEILIALYDESKDYEAIQKLSQQVEEEELFALFSDYLAEAPVFSQEPGTYHRELELGISAKSGSTIFYTLDGSQPEYGKAYEEPLKLKEGSVSIRAVSKNELGLFSEEIEGIYNIQFEAPEKPSVSPRGGSFNAPQSVTVTAPEGCSIFYTWDGTDPTANSEKYAGPLAVPEGNNILSLIVINEYNLCSDVLRCNYVYIP